MAATDTATAAMEYIANFRTACETIFATDITAESLIVFDGFPDPSFYNYIDWVSISELDVEQSTATMGPTRGRDENLTLTVWFSARRDGGSEQERICKERAYAMLRAVERYVRMTDTTLAGAVEWCMLASHSSSGATNEELIESGRFIEIEAKFTARVRIRG